MSISFSPSLSSCSQNDVSHGVVCGAALASIQEGGVRQRTLRGIAQCSGVGVHSGEKVTLRLLPADPDTGIVFIRTDLRNGARTVRALWHNVVETRLCTVIGNDHGGKVATVEHLMAALSASGVDNVVIELNGAEVPVMDGSADAFVHLIEGAGTREQEALRREIVILKPVEFSAQGKSVVLLPCEAPKFSVHIAFDNVLIGKQGYELTLSKEAFKAQISRARTFGFLKDVEAMTKLGLMRGGSLDNAIVIDGERVMNEDGLRYADEFVRHKTLDAVGDLALAGAPIRGHYKGVLPGHAMNNALLRALFSDPSAFAVRGQMDVSSFLAASA